jgi:hypothetical protein
LDEKQRSQSGSAGRGNLLLDIEAMQGYAAWNAAYRSGDSTDLLPILEEFWDPEGRLPASRRARGGRGWTTQRHRAALENQGRLCIPAADRAADRSVVD